MSQSNSTPLKQLLTALPQFIHRLQREGFNIGVGSYGDVHNLLLTLAAEGQLPDDFSQLRPLIAPILCCSEQQQQLFNHYFSDWLQVLQPQIPPPIVAELKQVEQEHKTTKRSFIVLALLVLLLVGLLGTPYGSYLGELISVRLFEKYHPAQSNDIVSLPKSDLVKPEQINITDTPIPIEIPQPTLSNLDKVKLALSACIAVLFLILPWYSLGYARLQRFLKHSLQSANVEKVFLKNQEKNLYSSSKDFSRTAQKLHKHRNLDVLFLDVEATVKRSIREYGFYTPVYKPIKALPEYLVLIDRSSFNDQPSYFVDILLDQLDYFELIIERYYFDKDFCRCYSQRHSTTFCRLENLQNLYANHCLIIFSNTQTFFDPLKSKLYPWIDDLLYWKSRFLFTLEMSQELSYYKQQMNKAGFVVLPTGKKGLDELAEYILGERAVEIEQPRIAIDKYPMLLQDRPFRFLENHTPAPEVVRDLLVQLQDYLGAEGFNWLTIFAVFSELNLWLTLCLGKKEMTQRVNEELLLRLTRLPWLRYGYMPNWLRKELLSNLNQQEEQALRQRFQFLLLTAVKEGNTDDLSLILTESSSLLTRKHQLLVNQEQKNTDDIKQDYVFQSFMAGRLTVKLPKLLNQRLLRFGSLEKIRLLLLLITLSATVLIWGYVNQSELAVNPDPPIPNSSLPLPATVAIKGGCFTMGSPETEAERQDDEKQHKVCVDDFQLGQYEVTIEQYRQCVTDGGCKEPAWLEKGSEYNINTGSNDAYTKAGMSLANKDNPITGVSWQNAMAYTQWLSNKTSKNYRLPTEAEWEYAARAATTTAFYTGNCINTKQANFDGTESYANCAKGEFKNQTVKVGSYPANPWGLYDMAGNVWEWTCSDYNQNYEGSETRCSIDSGTLRVLRGGSWNNYARDSRSAIRIYNTPVNRGSNCGFRFALGQPAK